MSAARQSISSTRIPLRYSLRICFDEEEPEEEDAAAAEWSTTTTAQRRRRRHVDESVVEQDEERDAEEEQADHDEEGDDERALLLFAPSVGDGEGARRRRRAGDGDERAGEVRAAGARVSLLEIASLWLPASAPRAVLPTVRLPPAARQNRLHHRAALMPFQILSTLREGTGAPAKVGDKLVVHYKGIADAGAFDDSRERGHAFTFALGCNKVIRGWDEALVGATKGARFTVRIPSADAYGPKGAPPRIPPNADLVFDLELLNINETLVEEGMRFRQEEEARVQKFLAVQDEAPRRGGGRRRRRAEGGEAAAATTAAAAPTPTRRRAARARRAAAAEEKKRKKKERKKERRKEKKEKKEKKSKKSKKKRHKSQSES